MNAPSCPRRHASQFADALYALGRYEESGQWELRGLELTSSDDLGTQVPGLGVRARLLARKGETSTALALAEQAESLAATMDSPREQGDAALNLAEVMYLAGEPTRASEFVRQAIEHYERKGATAYVARAHHLAAAWTAGKSAGSTVTQARQGTAFGLSRSA